jgi:hypothetical protein
MVGILLLLAASAGVGAAAFDDGPLTPDRWDPRVADLVRFVEQHRGHRFKHPVRVYFLSDARYRDIAGGGTGQAPPTPEDREYSRLAVAEYRAIGLMEGEPDLLAADETLQDSGTLAFYSPEDKVVNVRGTDMTVGLRVTLVHELTHALQDQYFDLSAIGDAVTADESGAARAVVEGDAVSVENAYVATLSESEQAEYDDESDRSGSQADEDLGEVPLILQVLFGSYYAVGNAFVEYWQASETGAPDLSRIDTVLRRLPRASAQLFLPSEYEAGVTLDDVLLPEDGDDDGDVFEVSTFGVDQLFLMFAERIDPLVALRALDGWRGDSYRAAVGEDGTLCVAANVSLATDGDVAEFTDAARSWLDALPDAADAHLLGPSGDERVVGFSTCDPGAEADMGLTGDAGPALTFPVTRLQAAAGSVSEGHDRAEAFCFGDEVIRHLTIEDLQAAERTAAIDDAVAAAEAACY